MPPPPRRAGSASSVPAGQPGRSASQAQPQPQAQRPPVAMGWLIQQHSGGMMARAPQRRWFVLDSSRCRLFYLRAPNSSESRGFIDLTAASVSFEDAAYSAQSAPATPGGSAPGQQQAAQSQPAQSAAEGPAHFTITAFDTNRIFPLAAESREVMMAWIDRIQQARNYFVAVHGPNAKPIPLGPHESPVAPSPLPKIDMTNAQVLGGDMRQTTFMNRLAKGVLTGVMMPITLPMQLLSGDGSSAPSSASLAHASSTDSLPRDNLAAGADEDDAASAASDTAAASSAAPSNQAPKRRQLKFNLLRLQRNKQTQNEEDPGLYDGEEERYIEALKLQLAEANNKLVDYQEQLRMLREQHTMKDALIRFTGAPDEKARSQLFVDQAEVIRSLKEELQSVRRENKDLREKNAHVKRALVDSTTKRDQETQQMVESTARLRELESTVEELRRQLTTSRQKDEAGPDSAAAAAAAGGAVASPEMVAAALQNEVRTLTQLQKQEARSKVALQNKLNQVQGQLQALWTRYLELLAYVTDLNSADEKLCSMLASAKELQLESLALRSDSLSTSEVEHNKYGFRLETDPQARLHLFKLKEVEKAQEAAWFEYLQTRGNQTITRADAKVKKLVRGGIPDKYRTQIWTEMIKDLVGQQMKFHGSDFYRRILEENDGKTSVSTKQIELDLLRTFPNHREYSNADSESIQRLRRVLVAYSWHERTIGYCQGMNMIVAVLLLFVDEETAFWGLVAIVEHLLPRAYFTSTMLGVQVDQRVLKDLVADRLPKLNAHLDRESIDISLVSFNFFLTVSVDSVPIDTALRIFDCFLFEGDKILFRFGLAMLKMHESAILAKTDKMELFGYLRSMPKKLYDATELFRNAFQVLNSFQGFSKRVIEDKRSHYRPLMEAEMEEMNRQRAKSNAARRPVTHDDDDADA